LLNSTLLELAGAIDTSSDPRCVLIDEL